ncbi:MAG: pseudouridylate synthase [Phycisphaerales bacterium]|nr:pseudouridylate synthase [Phycisphaerales bacterium]NNM24381.1 pseudouridylate synthase [Phycisphaerales bacterium]
MGPIQTPIDVIHQDDDVVVVDKPPGLTVHRHERSGRREPVVLQTLSKQLGRFLYPVHRLDRNTSGVLCFALSPDSARELQAALARPTCVKEYLVLVRGTTPPTFESTRPLRNDRGEPQPSRTECTRLAVCARCSLLRVRLHTGRYHQIRRHLNHLAHHVIGDTTHGKGRINQWFRDEYGLPRMFVHATRLVIDPLRTGSRAEWHAPLADDLRRFLTRLPDPPSPVVFDGTTSAGTWG